MSLPINDSLPIQGIGEDVFDHVVAVAAIIEGEFMRRTHRIIAHIVPTYQTLYTTDAVKEIADDVFASFCVICSFQIYRY
jgi:hypothetical protein